MGVARKQTARHYRLRAIALKYKYLLTIGTSDGKGKQIKIWSKVIWSMEPDSSHCYTSVEWLNQLTDHVWAKQNPDWNLNLIFKSCSIVSPMWYTYSHIHTDSCSMTIIYSFTHAIEFVLVYNWRRYGVLCPWKSGKSFTGRPFPSTQNPAYESVESGVVTSLHPDWIPRIRDSEIKTLKYVTFSYCWRSRT